MSVLVPRPRANQTLQTRSACWNASLVAERMRTPAIVRARDFAGLVAVAVAGQRMKEGRRVAQRRAFPDFAGG